MLQFCVYTISINNAHESQKSVVQQKVDDAYIEDRPFQIGRASCRERV